MKGEMPMWNEEEQENSEQKKNDPLYDNDPVRAQARDTAEKAAKQKKETEDKLRAAVEHATEKAKAKTAKLVADAADRQKQATLEELQKSPDDLNITQPDLTAEMADITSSISAETSAEIMKEAGIDAPQGVETELPQAAYDAAYKDQYEDTARLIGAETDAARDAEPTKAGDMHSMDSVISEMSEELKRETTGQTDQMNQMMQRDSRSARQETTLNQTLQEHSEWSTLDAKQGRSHEGLSAPRRPGNMPDKLQKDADLLAMAKEHGVDKALEYAKQAEQHRMTVDPSMKRHGQEGGR